MGANQQGLEPGLAPRQLENQVHPCFSSPGEAVLLQLTQAPQTLLEDLAHVHQPQRIPTGMAGNRELMQVSQEALLELNLCHGGTCSVVVSHPALHIRALGFPSCESPDTVQVRQGTQFGVGRDQRCPQLQGRCTDQTISRIAVHKQTTAR